MTPETLVLVACTTRPVLAVAVAVAAVVVAAQNALCHCTGHAPRVPPPPLTCVHPAAALPFPHCTARPAPTEGLRRASKQPASRLLLAMRAFALGVCALAALSAVAAADVGTVPTNVRGVAPSKLAAFVANYPVRLLRAAPVLPGGSRALTRAR